MLCQISASQQPSANAVSYFSIVEVSPWSVLVSWQKPSGTQQIKNYVLSGDVQATITDNLDQKYLFFFQDTGITPGTNVSVTITVNYNHQITSESSFATTYVETPGMLTFTVYQVSVLMF